MPDRILPDRTQRKLARKHLRTLGFFLFVLYKGCAPSICCPGALSSSGSEIMHSPRRIDPAGFLSLTSATNTPSSWSKASSDGEHCPHTLVCIIQRNIPKRSSFTLLWHTWKENFSCHFGFRSSSIVAVDAILIPAEYRGILMRKSGCDSTQSTSLYSAVCPASVLGLYAPDS